MQIMNGVKTTSIEELEFEAGLILANKFTTLESFQKENDVLCSTTGGVRVTISQNSKVIGFDGVAENTVGNTRVLGWTVSCTFSTKEVGAEKVKMALGYASVSTAENVTTVNLHQGVIPADAYNTLYVLGRMSDGTWRQICLKNAINVSGLSETRNNKDETVIAFDLRANYDMQDQDTPPTFIEYITPQQGGGEA